MRTTTLEGVPEDERFDIGGDDDREDNASTEDHMSNSTSRLDESTDQLPSMSEKARGKQPAARILASSRTTSTSSLPTFSSMASQPFQPSQEWLESWYESLPLATIFKTINEAKTGGGVPEKSSRSIDEAVRTSHDTAFTPGFTDGFNDPTTAHGIEASALRGGSAFKQSSSKSQPGLHDLTMLKLATDHTGSGEVPSVVAEPPINFEWSSVARVWYMSELWGRVYIHEAEVSQGIGGLYSGTNIVLFKRSSTTPEISLRSPKGAIDAVGNSLAQRISNISLKRE
jgi:hypothetical protein